jgi:hypothetical protein
VTILSLTSDVGIVKDRYGLTLSTRSSAAGDAYVDGPDYLFALQIGATERLMTASQQDETFLAPHTAMAFPWLMEGDVAAAHGALADGPNARTTKPTTSCELSRHADVETMRMGRLAEPPSSAALTSRKTHATLSSCSSRLCCCSSPDVQTRTWLLATGWSHSCFEDQGFPSAVIRARLAEGLQFQHDGCAASCQDGWSLVAGRWSLASRFDWMADVYQRAPASVGFFWPRPGLGASGGCGAVMLTC